MAFKKNRWTFLNSDFRFEIGTIKHLRNSLCSDEVSFFSKFNIASNTVKTYLQLSQNEKNPKKNTQNLSSPRFFEIFQCSLLEWLRKIYCKVSMIQ